MQLKILDIVLIVFIILKLTALIDWSWWLVLSPLFISAAASFLLINRKKSGEK